MTEIMVRPGRRSVEPRGESLADDVARLSRLLTRERGSLPAAYLKDRRLRRAYLTYFLPPNLAKIAIPLRELALHPARVFSKDRLRVLDLGSGPGTALLGIRQFFARNGMPVALECTAVDQVAENLREAEVLFREQAGIAGIPATLKTVKAVITTVAERSGGPYDLVVLSNVLNEMYAAEPHTVIRRTALVGRIMERFLAHDGSCIIIEPALRETSRDLLAVRDGLVDAGSTVYSPCLVQGRCPALAHPKDWCHEERPWEPPKVIAEIDSLIGLRKDALKFSYLVLRKDGRTLAEACGAGAFRVVSEPLVSKGKREIYLCGKQGRRLAVRLDKDASGHNGAFSALRRGDVVRMEGLVREERRFKVAGETRVTQEIASGSEKDAAPAG